MKEKKISVAITGNIGSGKSTFCRFLSEAGFPLINADDLAKEILHENKSVKKKIILTFGEMSYSKGSLNNSYLAENIFSDPGKVQKLNSIVHPVVISETNRLVAEYQKKSKVVFTEAALIYEADMEDFFNHVVLITSPLKIRLERAVKSKKFSESDFLKRDSNQIPQEEKIKRADFIFENNGSLSDLRKKADLLILILTSL